MSDPQDFFSNIKFEPKKTSSEVLNIPEVPEPIIIYSHLHWPELSPADAALKFIQNFNGEINIFTSSFTHAISPCSVVKHGKTGCQSFIISLTRDMRNFLNYQASLLVAHKSKKRPDFFAEIAGKYSEYAGCLLFNSIASYLGFKTRFKPDFELYADRDLGDIRIGSHILDFKHRNDSNGDGCFLDADYCEKRNLTDDMYFVHTTGLKKWEIADFKTVNKSYEVAICGFFDKNIFMEKSSLKRNGERRVLDIQDMCDLEQLFTLVIKGLMEEEGYLK